MDKIKRFREVANSLADLYEQKNTAYGDSFGKSVQKYGNIAALTRLSDKFNRMEQLVLNPNTNCDDERLVDTLKDMASYCIMFFMELEDKQ